jgi:hypothetical protein
MRHRHRRSEHLDNFSIGGSIRSRRDAAKDWNARAAQDIFDYKLFQARRIVIEMQEILVFLEAEALQAVGICELAERAELLGLQCMLQFVGHGHVSHGRDYTKREPYGKSVPSWLSGGLCSS